MNYITHSLGGAAAGLAVISVVNVNEPAIQSTILAGAVLGALFPDIDHRKSWIGHKLPIASNLVSTIFKHRGAVHTPACIALISFILGLLNFGWLHDLSYLSTYFIQGFIPGMMSHLILDTLNVQGIMWLWPLSEKRFHIFSIRTNSLMEAAVCIVLGLCLYGQFII